MALLQTRNLSAGYGDFQALFGIDLALDAGETLAIIGANGAGKSILMRALTGLVPCAPGTVQLDGQTVGGRAPEKIMPLGIAMVPEGRRLFPSLSVEENLLVGADKHAHAGHWNLQKIFELFPILRERRANPATAMSGGQQQMVAIGRALMSNPRILLCDELSLGLAPVIIRDIYAAFPKIQEQGILRGGLFALFATGLSLVFGIMRLVNLAHGDLIILGAFIILTLVTVTGLHPFLVVIVAAPIMLTIGWVLQSYLLNRVLGTNLLRPLLVTFGLSIILQKRIA